jgi:methylmalonyl-CoA carboxyltransferase 12S subunit
MSTASANSDQLAEALEALRHEVARLCTRVAALENGAGLKPAAPVPVAVAPAADPISEEILVVIGAAIAAFLGKTPHIRQVRLVSTSSWSQQGRATIQASHSLMAGHGRDRQ